MQSHAPQCTPVAPRVCTPAGTVAPRCAGDPGEPSSLARAYWSVRACARNTSCPHSCAHPPNADRRTTERHNDTDKVTCAHTRRTAFVFTLPRRFDWLLRAMCRDGSAGPARARTPSQRRAGPDTVEASATRLSRCSPPRSRRRALCPPSTTAPSPPRRRRGHLPELTQVPRWGSGGHRRHWNASAACPPRRCRGL